MLNVTETAASHLSEMLSQAPEGVAIRFVPEANTLVPKLDNPRPGDAEFEHDGQTVLVLDSQVADTLDDKTLDVQAGEQGPQLVLM